MINSLGMKLVYIKPGNFDRGSIEGKYDEKPVHNVKLTEGFEIAEGPVTFHQFEQYRPGFREVLRGITRQTSEQLAVIKEYDSELKDSDPVVGINWHDAASFCEWLSKREGKPYRLPSEAEWEYAACSDTAARGELRILSGVVEQWCLDWYGPYPSAPQTDPAGYRYGISRVTRGGSSFNPASTHRPTNRMSFLPDARYPGLGFRVVVGQAPISFIEEQLIPLSQQNISQEQFEWKSQKVASDIHVFIPPIQFVHIPDGSEGPIYSSHNHFPSIAWCPNGDLLATWFTSIGEEGTTLNIASSRLRLGSEQWEPASLFWSIADRNDHSCALWTDPESGTLYHFQGTGSHPNQGNQILVMRTSVDNGSNWSDPRIINDVRSMWNPHIVTKTRERYLIVTSDYNFDQPMWGRIIISKDNGHTWVAPKGRIHGQHPGIVQLKDGSLMAVGRDNWNELHTAGAGIGLPISTSHDWGESWIYRRDPSLGTGIDWRQRPVLIRLAEGPLLFVGFTDKWRNPAETTRKGIVITDAAGKQRKVFGMFSALSFDEGTTWQHHKLLTPGPEKREYNGGGNTGNFISDASHSEPAGYIQAIQTPDGMIHLISSKLLYRFNLAWLKIPTVAEEIGTMP